MQTQILPKRNNEIIKSFGKIKFLNYLSAV
uniref:Uncharacterized protein n=1 Tax=Rhizophora mucronata TaxID=61149 RepID=A0A2P2NT83_RHIMU